MNGAVAQSRFMSLVEAVGNIAIGFGINFAGNLLILPAFGLDVSVKSALGIGVIFTVVSIVRSFYVRRMFEAVRVRYGNFDPWQKGSA